MLGEGFLRALVYREEKKPTATSTRYRVKTYPDGPEEPDRSGTHSDSVEPQSRPAAAGPNQDNRGPPQTQRPGSSPALILDSDAAVCIEDCSLLIQYPDLTVADSGRISQSLFRTSTASSQPTFNIPIAPVHNQPDFQQEPLRNNASPVPDQGYLVMGDSLNESRDLTESRLEPMSNSLLNGLLEKQLEEVYLQHLTDNLARCNSHLENSLLHGLVPPPQSGGQLTEPDSLEPSLQSRSGEDDKKRIVYLSTQNVPCSSNFSSPVLRISEAEHTCLK